MKTTRIALTTLALLLTAMECAFCTRVWQTQRITTNHTWFSGGVQLWGDRIYWTDWRSGNAEVYQYDPSGGERRLMGDSGAGLAAAAVWENKLAVYRYVGSQYDLYLYDPDGGMTPISTQPGNQYHADLSDKLLVWEDCRSGTSQIYAWDPVNGDRQISPTSSEQTNPKVWGDTVVWEDARVSSYGSYQIRMWNPRDGERVLGYGNIPSIYEDKVVWWNMAKDVGQYPFHDYRDGNLQMWTPDTGTRTLCTHGRSGVFYSNLWGDTIVYGGGNGPTYAGSWDPVHGFSRLSEDSFSSMSYPSIYGNKVAWAGDYDIYLSTRVVPEPSGLVALAGCTGMLGILLRRRR